MWTWFEDDTLWERLESFLFSQFRSSKITVREAEQILACLPGARRPSRRLAPGSPPGGQRARTPGTRRVPGLGPVGPRTRRRELPEVGPVSRPQHAALGGGAPWPRERGTLRGSWTIWGGRAAVRAPRDRSPLGAVRSNPVLTAVSERRRAAGQAAKVARTASMRTRWTLLNAIVQHHTPWQPQEVPSAAQTRSP